MKKTKRKTVFFSKKEWETVCKRAKFLKMKPAAFIRNMSVHKLWKYYHAEDLCLPFQKMNRIGANLNSIIKVAENTNSKYLDRLKSLRKRFEDCRTLLNNYYRKILNTD